MPVICVSADGLEKKVICAKGETLLQALQEGGIYLPADCAGRGSCGRCLVRLRDGTLPPSRADCQLLTQEQLRGGWRLACQAQPREDCAVELPACRENDLTVLTEAAVPAWMHPKMRRQEDKGYGIAIDIGTTTLAFSLIELSSGENCAICSSVNHQRSFGADVLSRIAASQQGAGPLLQESICRDLYTGIHRLLAMYPLAEGRLCRVVIAGNTTMYHLLLGLSCEMLGRTPFAPVHTQALHTDAARLLSVVLPQEEKEFFAKIEVILLPGVSAFIGADISAGMLSCGYSRQERLCLLLDLGTNGEMVIGDANRRLAASAAAGPAFEGGNITWGIAGVAGAISKIMIAEDEVECKTIGDALPIGICGSGVISVTAELLRNGYVDDTGLLCDSFAETGFSLAQTLRGEEIVFTQEDIRQFQLAKAAIRAGIETLLKRYPARYEDVAGVYLSGGFGFGLDVDEAIAIGLLPTAFRGRVYAAGNTSLAGAAAVLLQPQLLSETQVLADGTRELVLAEVPEFAEAYVEAMGFHV